MARLAAGATTGAGIGSVTTGGTSATASGNPVPSGGGSSPLAAAAFLAGVFAPAGAAVPGPELAPTDGLPLPEDGFAAGFAGALPAFDIASENEPWRGASAPPPSGDWAGAATGGAAAGDDELTDRVAMTHRLQSPCQPRGLPAAAVPRAC